MELEEKMSSDWTRPGEKIPAPTPEEYFAELALVAEIMVCTARDKAAIRARAEEEP